MSSPERGLLDKYLSRALDPFDRPYTRLGLMTRCVNDIEWHGRTAKTEVYLPGVRGRRIKNRRRLFPGGPLGDVCLGGMDGRPLLVEFRSVDLLDALGGAHERHSALAHHYLKRSEPPYPSTLPLQLAVQLAQDITDSVEIAEDVVDALWSNTLSSPLGQAHLIALYLLMVEDEARKRRWRRVDLARWEDAGLTHPVLKPKRRAPVERPRSPSRPSGHVFRLTDRQVSLLALFERADEQGKRHIEQVAAVGANRRGTQAVVRQNVKSPKQEES